MNPIGAAHRQQEAWREIRRSNTSAEKNMHASNAEILDAYQRLTEQELLALHRFAQRHLASIYTEPLDLIHEALHRSLTGRRNWPKGLSFAVYMVQTMKSIVGHDRERLDNQAARSVSFEELEERGRSAGAWPSAEDQAIVFEQFELARKVAEQAKTDLAGDGAALKVLDGMLAGLSPRETCDCFGLAAKDFDAARHRVMRRLRGGELH